MNFCLPKCIVILFFIFVVEILASVDYEDEDTKPFWGRCPWIRNKLKNGRVKVRSRGRIAKFLCNSGYEMVGKRFATCVRGQWNNPIPLCVARGCYQLPEPANGKVAEMYMGALLVYDCLPGYALQGPMSLHCDGINWSDTVPTCKVAIEQPETSCDFEDPDLCGWSHDQTQDFLWRRNQFGTPSGHVGTGPSYDHTFGKGKAGFYLYLEASSPRKEKDVCRLFSPVFPENYSPGCFTFWYHMYGATTGGLRVYVKPESHVFGELSPTWEKYGDQGNQWLRGEIDIDDFSENFQVIIEGIRGSSYVGDTAIDDVNLWPANCSTVRLLNSTSSEASAESCRGRCKEPDSASVCECTENCVSNNTCCSDYTKICTSGTESSSWDGETPPSFIVTDYLNAATEQQTSSTTSLLTVPSTAVERTSFTPASTRGTSSTTLKPSEPSSVMEKSSSTSSNTVPQEISTVRSSTQSVAQNATLSTSTTTTSEAIATTHEITTDIVTEIRPAEKSSSKGSTATLPTTITSSTSKVTAEVVESTTLFTKSTRMNNISSSITYPHLTTAKTLDNFTTMKMETSASTAGVTTKAEAQTVSTGSPSTAEVPLHIPSSTDNTTAPATNSTSAEVPQILTTSQTVLQTEKSEARYTARFPPWMRNLTTPRSTTPRRKETTPLTTTSSSTSSTTPTSPTTTPSTTTKASAVRVTVPHLTTTTETVSEFSVSRPFKTGDKFDKKKDDDNKQTVHDTADESSVLPPSKSVSKSEESSSTPAAAVSVVLLLLAALACGTAYYFFRHRARSLSKLPEDSEIRFLSDNEVLEFSEGSEKLRYS